jgi:hypothetical protein
MYVRCTMLVNGAQCVPSFGHKKASFPRCGRETERRKGRRRYGLALPAAATMNRPNVGSEPKATKVTTAEDIRISRISALFFVDPSLRLEP